MPQVAKRTLADAIKTGTPDAVYLLHGDNSFLKEERVRAAVDRFSDPAMRDFNTDILRASETDAGRLATALDALPMMSERRVVVVRDFSALRKDARAVLDRYLERPSPDTVLILVAAPGWKVEATVTSRAKVEECEALDDDETVEWAKGRAAGLGTSLNDAAARLLIRATGSDLALIDGEVRKLRDFAGTEEIDEASIAAVVGVTAGGTAEDLIDLVCARDGAAAARLVAVALAQPKSSAVGLVLALTSHMLLIGHLVSSGARGNPRQKSGELYAVMGESRAAVVGRPWGEAVTAVTGNADRWDRASVDRALLLLAEADGALKDSTFSSDEQILATLLLTMCAGSRRQLRSA